ncbi:hypothetical protein F7725_020215 [Dissostichus mawsoni]|uniref:Uncharacterized protein n=1 Tax=Dissostichus mawsoni TaxID=36200 RepID=A0A7J5YF79_DISMA|nr:hypothetical protein F7725_020215 [Dissostichus mawsoni]
MSGGDVGSVLVSEEGKAVNSERAGGAAGACNHQQSCYCHSPQSKSVRRSERCCGPSSSRRLHIREEEASS